MYVVRDPQKSDLHCLIRENYRQVFFDKEVNGTNLPFHLEREFKKISDLRKSRFWNGAISLHSMSKR